MRVGLNASFWHRPDTGSGQYLQALHAALLRNAPELELLLFAPRARSKDCSAS